MTTLTPTASGARRDSKRNRRDSDRVCEAMLELVLSDGMRVRLYGEAQRPVLERILKQLFPR